MLETLAYKLNECKSENENKRDAAKLVDNIVSWGHTLKVDNRQLIAQYDITEMVGVLISLKWWVFYIAKS